MCPTNWVEFMNFCNFWYILQLTHHPKVAKISLKKMYTIT